MRLSAVRAGMKAVAVFDNGPKNGDVSIYEVLKVDRVKVQDEHGNVGWLYPESIKREFTEERYVELVTTPPAEAGGFSAQLCGNPLA